MCTITQALHEAIKNSGHSYQTIASLIGLSPASFSQRKHGTVSWSLDECFAILDILNVPRSELARYFQGRLKG